MKNNKNNNFIIRFKNVFFSYDSQKKIKILKNLNFDILTGEHIVVVGENGSGKSTLGKLIGGLICGFTGNIQILSSSFEKSNHRNFLKKIGMIFQNPESQFIKETVDEEIAFGLENHMVPNSKMNEKILNIVKKLNISSILFSKSSELSASEKQKVAIASTLVFKPKLIIFDEPTSYLDFFSKEGVFKIIDEINKENYTIIEITHNMERILKSDRVMVLENGKIIFFDKPNKLIKIKDLKKFDKNNSIKLPFINKLSLELYKKGIIKQQILNEEELIKKICHLKN